MMKKHLVMGVVVITLLAIIISIVLVWMMSYQSDMLTSPSPNASFQRQPFYHPNQNNPDTVENFTSDFQRQPFYYPNQNNPNTAENFTSEPLEDTSNETIDQPENININPAGETTEPSSPVLEQPKIFWSQLNQSLLELEQEQSAIMTLLSQKYAVRVEPETQAVEPPVKVMAPTDPKTVEPQPEIPQKVTTTTKMVTTTARAVEPKTNPLITPTVETEPETPQTVAAETRIITMTRPIESETNTLMTVTKPMELNDLLGKKPSLQPRELTWDTDWFIPLNSANTWLNIGQQILELEQWREKTINSLNTKLSYHDSNQENEQ
jgi:hypothetical protein